jgi:hypothetical protein
MTRKDFDLIASTKVNPRFDHGRFVAACIPSISY